MTTEKRKAFNRFSYPLPTIEQMKVITRTLVFVTPEMAAKFLKQNKNNRPIRPFKVEVYINLLKAGEWGISPESIKFFVDGTLMDGQHRLEMVVQTGVGQWMFIDRNVPFGCARYQDQGMPRSAADLTGLTKKAVSMSHCIWEFNGPANSSLRMAPIVETVYQSIGDYLDLAESITSGDKLTKLGRAPIRAAFALALSQGEKADYALATFEQFIRGGKGVPVIGDTLRFHVVGLTAGTTVALNRELMTKTWLVLDESMAERTKFGVKMMKKAEAAIASIIRTRIPDLDRFYKQIKDSKIKNPASSHKAGGGKTFKEDRTFDY